MSQQKLTYIFASSLPMRSSLDHQCSITTLDNVVSCANSEGPDQPCANAQAGQGLS